MKSVHGMSTRKAKHVKKKGHEYEKEFAIACAIDPDNQNPGIVLPGREKADVILRYSNTKPKILEGLEKISGYKSPYNIQIYNGKRKQIADVSSGSLSLYFQGSSFVCIDSWIGARKSVDKEGIKLTNDFLLENLRCNPDTFILPLLNGYKEEYKPDFYAIQNNSSEEIPAKLKPSFATNGRYHIFCEEDIQDVFLNYVSWHTTSGIRGKIAGKPRIVGNIVVDGVSYHMCQLETRNEAKQHGQLHFWCKAPFLLYILRDLLEKKHYILKP